ncbi:putative E3 ubiquitin-protein ligase HECTD1-like isoform X6 [Diplonema papillatum]|nr:putative E3 ubiquitin-protein ligase HECTD1-like isoform X6 [Diplonema papillatum]
MPNQGLDVVQPQGGGRLRSFKVRRPPPASARDASLFFCVDCSQLCGVEDLILDGSHRAHRYIYAVEKAMLIHDDLAMHADAVTAALPAFDERVAEVRGNAKALEEMVAEQGREVEKRFACLVKKAELRKAALLRELDEFKDSRLRQLASSEAGMRGSRELAVALLRDLTALGKEIEAAGLQAKSPVMQDLLANEPLSPLDGNTPCGRSARRSFSTSCRPSSPRPHSAPGSPFSERRGSALSIESAGSPVPAMQEVLGHSGSSGGLQTRGELISFLRGREADRQQRLGAGLPLGALERGGCVDAAAESLGGCPAEVAAARSPGKAPKGGFADSNRSDDGGPQRAGARRGLPPPLTPLMGTYVRSHRELHDALSAILAGTTTVPEVERVEVAFNSQIDVDIAKHGRCVIHRSGFEKPSGSRYGGIRIKPPPADTLQHLQAMPKGLVYTLGTKGGATGYRNPTTGGLLQVRTSALCEKGGLQEIFSRRPSRLGEEEGPGLLTKNQRDAALVMGFGEDMRFAVSHICLRHGAATDQHALRSFVLEGARAAVQDVAASDFVTVLSVKNRAGLGARPYQLTVLAVSPPHYVAHNVFRLRMTGPNNSASADECWKLCLGGIEMFGTLFN